ncbi:hypothetical protein UlMin_034676 [Ulmus minor]
MDSSPISIMKRPSSRRTPSFSSSSSSGSSSLGYSSSYNLEDSPPRSTPSTPLRFSGVPFSWEHFPGIPKKQFSKKKQEPSLLNLLPLPNPPTNPPTTKKKFTSEDHNNNGVRKTKSNLNNKNLDRDPFFAALVECSKDEDDHLVPNERETNSGNLWSITNSKVSRSLSDRFGFISLYTSCKRTCTVAESIIYLPRSSTSSYDLINTRSR